MERIKEFFSSYDFSTFSIPKMELNNIIDILVVSYVLYKIFCWVKETRAWALFKGIAVIMLVSFFASVFRLYTVSWVIENTLSVGIFIAVVIFQPELRKALEQIGKGKFMDMLSGGETIIDGDNSHSVEEIITAVKVMSKARTGALIVIEQKVPLGDLENTGIPIDATISSQLLINIFENKTPLHDGAVIIRNNRIASATCILPLTQALISHDLGTRHRAAIGASEVSDAFIVVVSEETGNISIAKESKLYSKLSEDEIRNMLSVGSKQGKKKLSLRKGRNDA